MRMTKLIAGGVVGVILMGAASPTFALPLASNGAALTQAAPETTTDVRWRRGWGWAGVGALGLGLALGAAPYYGYGPGYYYGPPAPAYGYGPAYYGGPVYAGPPGGDAVAYCMQTYRSYNPRTGMFLGYDGAYHPCP